MVVLSSKLGCPKMTVFEIEKGSFRTPRKIGFLSLLSSYFLLSSSSLSEFMFLGAFLGF